MTAVGLVPILAPLLALGVVAAGIGALAARSLFVCSLWVSVAGAIASVLLALLGALSGALTFALIVATWTPLLLLAAMMLSKRTTKSVARRPWLATLTAIAAACVLAWAGAGTMPTAAALHVGVNANLAYWLSLLLVAVVAICVGLLGPGERGVLDADGAS